MTIPLRKLRPGGREPRAILYGRVSHDQYAATTSGVGRSVKQQLRIGRQVAGESGWTVVGEYSDNDRSASQYARGTREDWKQVEDLIRSGGADILWLWELSRGTRDRVVWAHLVDACQAHRMYIGLDDDLWDTTNPDHMAYLDDQMVRSIHESGKARKRIVRDMSSHAEEGRPHGWAHYAYDREYDPATGELIQQIPNSQRAQLCVRIAHDLVVRKKSRTGIAAQLNQDGVRTPGGVLAGEERVLKSGRRVRSRGWTAITIDQLMSSPTLMGKRAYNGRIIEEGGWEPVLDEETWWAVQRALGVRGFGGAAKAAPDPSAPVRREGAVGYLVSALMVCGICDAPCYVNPGWRPGSPVYYCTGMGPGSPRHGRRRIPVVDHAVQVQLFAHLDNPGVRASLVPAEQEGSEVRRAQARVGTLEAELEQLYADVEAGRVSRRMAAADETRLVGALESARQEAVPEVVDPLMLELAGGDPRQVWAGWDLAQRRAALRMLTEPRGIRMLPIGGGRRQLPPDEHVQMVWRGV